MKHEGGRRRKPNPQPPSAEVFPFSFCILHSTFPAAGGWRSGSAAPLHGDGRGFESLIAHQLSPERSEKRRLPRRSEAQTGERTATLRASAWQASQRSLSKNRGSTLKAGWMIPRGFGLRQPSAALHRPPCGEKVAEGCRSPRRYRAIRSPKLSSWPQIFLNRPSSLSGLAQDFLLVIERQESWRV